MKTYEYKLLDSGNFKKLEQLGPYKIIRPAPQAIWSPSNSKSWKNPTCEFIRTGESTGSWNNAPHKLLEGFKLNLGSIAVESKLTNFGHIGFFPEHHSHANTIEEYLKNSKIKEPQVLNLFAHTGVLSLLLAQKNINVTHVDSSKSSNQWGQKNALLSKTPSNKIRWITEDVTKFVSKELRRSKKYDVVILDPPTYGRGSKSEVWKIEKDLGNLLILIKKLMVPNSMVILSNHTPGITPISLENILTDKLGNTSKIKSFENLIDHPKRPLPCGACAIYIKKG
jgi:23S rRNA (cytosine1962-C5)-methyltransferase